MAEHDDLIHTLRTVKPFAELPAGSLAQLAACAKEITHHQGELLLRQGGEADHLNLIEHGQVALEIHVPGRSALIVETVGPGHFIGWSWLVSPYIARFDARAIGLVRSVRIEAACLRALMADQPAIAVPIYQHFLSLLSHRLTAAQLQLADIYSHPGDYMSAHRVDEEALPPAKPSPGKLKKEDKKKGKKA